MKTNKDTGMLGEQMAAAYLQKHGYTLLHQNWRFSHYEIDIIAEKNGILHFIEVKTRTNLKFGYPEESVSSKKMESIMKASEAYLNQFNITSRIQFDILSITIFTNKEVEYLLLEDVHE